MKNFLKIFVFSFLAFTISCKDSDDISIDSLKAKVAKDPLFLAYNDALDKEVELFAKGELSFKGVDMNYINKNQESVQNEAQLIQLYEKAGMSNAKTYLTVSGNLKAAYAKIVNKYYRLANMSVEERRAFMKSIKVPMKQLDALSVLKERRKNEAERAKNAR